MQFWKNLTLTAPLGTRGSVISSLTLGKLAQCRTVCLKLLGLHVYPSLEQTKNWHESWTDGVESVGLIPSVSYVGKHGFGPVATLTYILPLNVNVSTALLTGVGASRVWPSDS